MARRQAAAEAGPPALLRLAGHPLRWRLLRELARSDRQVHELTGLLGERQSLVSYHLGKLRAGRLVSARRSSADARDTYYTADLTAFADLLAAAGTALHPGLASARRPVDRTGGLVGRPRRVLFLCTGNSARSQMAEALLRQRAGGSVHPFSAGSHPKSLHPDAVRVMRERGIDISGQRPKHLDAFAGQRFHAVVSLCDRIREVCPDFPGSPELIHWSIPDPAATDDLAAFERTAAELETRVGFLLAALRDPPVTSRQVTRT